MTPATPSRDLSPATHRLCNLFLPRFKWGIKTTVGTYLFVNYQRLALIGLHLLLIPVAYCLAFLLRFDFRIPYQYAVVIWDTLPLVVAARLCAFASYRVYRGWLRYSGMPEMSAILKAVTISSALIVTGLGVTGQLAQVPRSVLVLDWITAVLLFGGARVCVRLYREELLSIIRSRSKENGTPAVIVGAGTAASMLIREILGDAASKLTPVAVVDDDPAKRHSYLHGVPVAGPVSELRRVARQSGAKLIVVAVPSATAQQIRRIVDHCMETGLDFRIIPTVQELIDNRAMVTQLREVQIEDLLGRDVVSLNLGTTASQIQGKVVLITGGAGSIGSELARQVARLKPARLILFEQAESPLYFIHMELSKAYPRLEVVPIIGDITDNARVAEVFSTYHPDCVFHAAAYKHVPMMEFNVREAVRNNVLGTLCLALNAAKHGARQFVLISTDKAVRPSSVMGATKRIAERIVLGWPALRLSRTDFRAVRFGNVLGSDGSVIPLFKRQLASGGPLTVTHPDVTRYFMTIPEASQLLLLASSLPEATGRICMLEMGNPIRIADLAKNLIRLSGLRPGIDVCISFTGLRPGEKLIEELMSDVEATVPTTAQKVRVVQTDEPDGQMVEAAVDQLTAAAILGDDRRMLHAIRLLVPECVAPLRNRTGSIEHTSLIPAALVVAAGDKRLPAAATTEADADSAQLAPDLAADDLAEALGA